MQGPHSCLLGNSVDRTSGTPETFVGLETASSSPSDLPPTKQIRHYSADARQWKHHFLIMFNTMEKAEYLKDPASHNPSVKPSISSVNLKRRQFSEQLFCRAKRKDFPYQIFPAQGTERISGAQIQLEVKVSILAQKNSKGTFICRTVVPKGKTVAL